MERLTIDSDDEGHQFLSAQELSVSTGSYVLHMDANRVLNTSVAMALSDTSCAVYDISTMKKTQDLCGHSRPVSNVRFSPNEGNLVYSSSYDGTVKLWDLRVKDKCVREFRDDSEGSSKLKPLSHFDVSRSGKVICASTELIDDDSFVLFWDARSANLLGGYWESHMDDITQVKFHHQQEDILATGSTDGLVNIFDVSQCSEEDALLHSLNTESSVEKVRWLAPDVVSCITHTQDLQIWNCDGAAPILRFDRQSIRSKSQMTESDGCFLADVHRTSEPEEALVVVGSTSGQGEGLVVLRMCDKRLNPASGLAGNRQIVRASCYFEDSRVLVTGGEAGILSVWKCRTQAGVETGSHLKVGKRKQHRKKPY